METGTRPSAPAATARSAAGIATTFACLSMLVSYLPFSEVNASVTALAGAVGAGPGAITWIADSYPVALAAVVLPAGALTARFGARRITSAGLVATALGAAVVLAAGAAPAAALGLLLAGTAICGVGGGLVMSASLALINASAATAGTRARGIGLWAAALVVGLAAGPFVGAAVLTSASWSASWSALAVPAGVLAAGLHVLRRRVPETAIAPGRPDLAGSVLAAGSVLTVLAATIGAGTAGWGSPGAVTPLAVGLALAAALVVIERHRPEGVLRLELFASPAFIAAAVAAAAALFTMAGLVVVVGIDLAAARVGHLQIAVRLLPLFGGNIAASVLASRLSTLLGRNRILVGGLALAAAGAASVALAGVHPAAPAAFAAALAVTGTGTGLVMATTSTVAVNAVTADDPSSAPTLAAMAGATNNALRQIGASLGPAVLTATVVAAHDPIAHDPIALDRAAGSAALVTAAVLAAAAALTAGLLHHRR